MQKKNVLYIKELRQYLPRGYAKEVVKELSNISERTVYNVVSGLTYNEQVAAVLLKLIEKNLILKKQNEKKSEIIIDLLKT